MKTLVSIVILLAATSAFAQKRFDMVMTVDSVEREFIVVRPSGPAPAGGYPIVMMFHGSSGNGEKFFNISGWKEKGEEEKFIAVFPSALEYCMIENGRQHRTTKWNNGATQEEACPVQILKDDVFFVRKMLDTIQSVFPIDRNRIYASGFSNGGVFVGKLAIEMSDVFAALTMASGSLNPLDSARPKRNIPLAYIVGANDPGVLERVGLPVIPFNDSALAVLNGVNDRILPTFNLTYDYTRSESENTMTWRYATPASAEPASEFSITLIKGLEHQYPNGTNHPTVAANAFWNFFQRFTLTSRVDDATAADAAVRIYPNPARTEVTVEGSDAQLIVIRNLLGEKMLEQKVDGRTTVPLDGLAAGHYLIELGSDRPTTTRSLVVVE
jgi:polyhydroxybutyrate depolymerase